VRILREADVIACEDTRWTRRLLEHYGIASPLVSYHEYNEAERARELVAKLADGLTIALVSDAGMPLISDPGYRLVRAALERGIRVEPIPGASALVAALAASGLPTDSFHFGGFLPSKAGQRLRVLESLQAETATLIFYEAPHRILQTLAAIEQVFGDRPVVAARELTKLHEEFLRGTAAQIRDQLGSRGTVRGEITLLIGKGADTVADPTPVAEAVEQCTAEGMSRMDAIKTVAQRRGLSKRQVYSELERLKR
jgi:16S rRNA (cytidine1402-2'-O)-methyltransferase